MPGAGMPDFWELLISFIYAGKKGNRADFPVSERVLSATSASTGKMARKDTLITTAYGLNQPAKSRGYVR